MKTITKRLTPKLDYHQPTTQAGFRAGFRTRDHLLVMKQVIEKAIDYNKPLLKVTHYKIQYGNGSKMKG